MRSWCLRVSRQCPARDPFTQNLGHALSGNVTPEKILVAATTYIRDPKVAAFVLERANGNCEACKEPAPFVRRSTGEPYLEVHHRERLADGGPDTVENAVALCPNCHRQAHYGTPA
ncbi:HNH endonuclease [Oleiagrimonas sp. C23AA]|nr:HNH endonuclease [Oleiagrimonas sp. C23AA]